MKALLAIGLLVAACGAHTEPDGPQLLTIPADHCGVLTSADGETMRIGTEQGELAVVPERTEYSVSFEFRFYGEHVRLCTAPTPAAGERCGCE